MLYYLSFLPNFVFQPTGDNETGDEYMLLFFGETWLVVLWLPSEQYRCLSCAVHM